MMPLNNPTHQSNRSELFRKQASSLAVLVPVENNVSVVFYETAFSEGPIERPESVL